MLNKKTLDRTYDEIARNVLGRMAELPQLRELKTELSSRAGAGTDSGSGSTMTRSMRSSRATTG